MVVNDHKFKAIEDISIKCGFNELGEGRNYYIYANFNHVKLENYSKNNPTGLYFIYHNRRNDCGYRPAWAVYFQ